MIFLQDLAHYNHFMVCRFVGVVVSFSTVGLFALVSASGTKTSSMQQPDLASSAYELIEAVNNLRASYGLTSYNISPILMTTAQVHADYMAVTQNVSHTGLGGSSVTERLLAAGYPLAGDLSLGGFRSENITSGSEAKTAQEAVNGWTGDAPHLNTMISPNLTEIGAGVSVNGGRVYYVIDCALPTQNGVPQPAAVPAAAGEATVIPGGGVIVPIELAAPNADGDLIHEVKAGQSLWQIAIAYEMKIDEIKRLNNLYDNNIHPGNKLLIKKGVTVAATVPGGTSTVDAVTSTATMPIPTEPVDTPTLTATAIVMPVTASTNSIMGIAIGIIAFAFLGGGIVVRLGASRRTDSSTKE